MASAKNAERRRVGDILRAIIEGGQIFDKLVDTQRFTAAQFSNDFWYFGLHAGDSARNIASGWLMEELFGCRNSLRCSQVFGIGLSS